MATKKNANHSPLSINPETFQGWSKLEPNEQETIRTESNLLMEARHLEAKSKLAQGEHLTKLRDILEPKRMFLAFLLEVFDMSRATAYRYIDLYSTAQVHLPAPVLEMAIQKGTRITPKLLEENPAPVTTDRGKIIEYLTSLKTVRAEPADKSVDDILKECVNFIGTRFQQLPQNTKTRSNFIRSLVGMLLNKFGIATESTFTPIAIPESFRASRGRPRQQAVA